MAAKILLVEDDNNLREIYEARLQAEGYEIATAKDGEEALVVAKAQKPDLIISDVMMPRVSGFEMLDILRNTDGLKYTKVIMLTALGQADDKTRANSLGADRYLVKSQVTLEDIVKAAHELIEGTAATPAAAPATAAEAVTPVQPAEASSTLTAPLAAPAPATAVTAMPVAAAPAPAVTPTVATVPMAAPPADTSAPAVAPSPASVAAPVIPLAPTMAPPVSAAPVVAPTPAPLAAAEQPGVSTAMPAPSAPVVPAAADVPAQSPPSTGGIEPAADGAAKADDAVLASAVQDLTAGSTPAVPAPVSTPSTMPSPTPLVTSVPAAPTVLPQATAAYLTPPPAVPAAGGADAAQEEAARRNSVTIANKKIIQPLQSEPKPGLDELLAREEAKAVTDSTQAQSPAAGLSVMSMPPVPAPAAPATPPAAAPQTGTVVTPGAAPAKPADFDPNNIAL
ncbi:MAG TPA: response regulator [Candidatus Saccharimonadales bacterium]|nr:response regulator [Candidatus Saccharimonadales bacterium]